LYFFVCFVLLIINLCLKLYKSYYFFVDFSIKSITFRKICKKIINEAEKKLIKYFKKSYEKIKKIKKKR
jgi:hypothetical protein